jgi:hypothetical protein
MSPSVAKLELCIHHLVSQHCGCVIAIDNRVAGLDTYLLSHHLLQMNLMWSEYAHEIYTIEHSVLICNLQHFCKVQGILNK